MAGLQVAKLGGEAMATAENIQHSTTAARRDGRNRIVVVSAPGAVNGLPKVTRDLRAGARKTLYPNGHSAREEFQRVAARYEANERGLGLRLNLASQFLGLLEREDGRAGGRIEQARSQKRRDPIEALGEKLQAQLVTELYRQQGINAIAVDGTDFLRLTVDRRGQAFVAPPDYAYIASVLGPLLERYEMLVLAGYYGALPDGQIRTLGESGSNYTQTAVAVAMNAEVTITYTNVDGVLRANPKIVPDATRIESLSLELLAALSSRTDGPVFQGKGIDPLVYAYRKQGRLIPLYIRSLEEDSQGTRITANYQSLPRHPVEGIGYQGDMIALEISDTMMDGPGVIEAVGRVLAQRGISVEYPTGPDPLCMSVLVNAAQLGEDAAERRATIEGVLVELGREFPAADIQAIENLAVVSAVGERLYRMEGIGLMARMGSALGRKGISATHLAGAGNVFAFAVHNGDGIHAVRALYEEFRADWDTEPARTGMSRARLALVNGV